MFRSALLTFILLVCVVFNVACSAAPVSPTPEANRVNPASAYCEQQGYTLQIVTEADGSQRGECVFPDGSVCDEWAYYRGECGSTSKAAESDDAAPQADMVNPASAYCEQQGYTLQIVTEADGSQRGECVFPDGSVCDEWAYFRGECSPAGAAPLAFDPADYQGWWTYTHPVYGFTLKLPDGWLVDEALDDPLLSGHLLTLHPADAAQKQAIRLTFRRVGEEVLLWPTGVGQGEFTPQGALEVGGQRVQRVLLVCPSEAVHSIWYQSGEDLPHITRGGLEFGFILSAAPTHCEPGYSLGDDMQRTGDMIVASLQTP